MNNLFAAYNGAGDLIADGYSYADALAGAIRAGYYEDEVFIVRVSA